MTERGSAYIDSSPDQQGTNTLAPLMSHAHALELDVKPLSFVSADPGRDICDVAQVKDVVYASTRVPGLRDSIVEGADSVKVLRSVAKIEQRYDIELEDDDVFGLKRIDDVVNVIEKELGGRARP